jgi:two-component system, LytTR family, sensor kinase
MATNETLIDVDALEAPAKREAHAHTATGQPVQPEISRRLTTQIHVFTALFWTAMFIVHTLQMELANEREDLRTIAARAGISVVAFVLCLPIGAVIRRTLNRPPLRRVAAVGAACLPAAVIFATLGHMTWYEILKVAEPSYPALIGIAIQTHYYFILFVLWSVFCALILYSAQLQERERKLLEAQALAHEAELKMLRYQINPHFLFNTLNAVSALIVTGQSAAADAMVAKLARFFRNALSRESSAKVPLEEDIRVQVEYLTIELTRFPDRLKWSIELEPGLEQALVPHLILQPLFENAIKHGVARSSAPIDIRLAAHRSGGELRIAIENTFRACAQDEARNGVGVGLVNVARRLSSFYGDRGALSAGERGERFVVELRLPLELTL